MPMNSKLACIAGAAICALGTEAGALTLTAGSAWPSPTIAVCWDGPRKAHKQERRMVRKAIAATWERESAVRFTGWRACHDDSAGIRIAFENSHPRTNGRGTGIDGLSKGVILPPLWSVAALSINLKATVHEFGHALGFGHEHARSDAPEPKRCGAFDGTGKRHIEPDVAITPFDVDSIMVACVSMATVRFSRGTPSLSALDIFGLIRTYGSNPKNVLDRDETGDRFGAALLVRDMDGDGVADLMVGAPGEDGGSGAVYLYRGDRKRGFRPLARYTPADFGIGDADGYRFGSAMTWRTATGAAPARLIVHANHPTDGAGFQLAVAAGSAPDVAGRSDMPVPPPRPRTAALMPDLATPPMFGFPDLSGRGGRDLRVQWHDLDGDGIDDAVIGAPHADGAAERSGAVVILRGQTDTGSSAKAAAWYWFGQAY